MITVEALDILLRVQGMRTFESRMRAARGSVLGLGRAVRNENASTSAALIKAASKVSLALGAAAVVATATGYKLAVEFEREMTLVHTQAGASAAEVASLKNQVLDLAKVMPQGPIELAKGLYHLESVGLRGAAAMDALKIAAEGAAVGHASLEQTTSALGAAWLVAIPGAGNLRHTMAMLNATVGAGNMRMDELVTALGTGVLPTAKEAGLQLQDVMGALAILKDEGYGAYGAMAQFATALHFFTSPTAKATDAFKKLGMGQMELARTMREKGMVPALEELHTKLLEFSPDLTKQEKIMGEILPGGRGRVFRVLLNQIDRYQMKIDQIMGTSGNFNQAVAATHETSAYKLDRAWSRLQVSLIKLGDALKGTLTPALTTFMDWLSWAALELIDLPGQIKDAWNALPGPIQDLIQVVFSLIGAYMIYRGVATGITAINALLALSWDAVTFAAEYAYLSMLIAMDNPIMLGIIALIAIILLIVTHWKWVKNAAHNTLHWITQAAKNTGHWLKTAFNDAINFIVGKFQWLMNKTKTARGILGTILKYSPAGLAVQGANAAAGAVGLPHHALGGTQMHAGAALVGEWGPEIVHLPALARVSPLVSGARRRDDGATPVRGGDGTDGYPLHADIALHLDGKEIARSTAKVIATKKARK